jgi:alkylated DNA repair dioxygenase AlkB
MTYPVLTRQSCHQTREHAVFSRRQKHLHTVFPIGSQDASMSKRTLDCFFTPPAKKLRVTGPVIGPGPQSAIATSYPTYPWPVPYLPPHVAAEIETLVTASGQEIKDQPHLDLLYFRPFIPRTIERAMFEFLRSELFFYRVKYTIQRYGKSTEVNTPRFTTVFGVDQTSRFIAEPPSVVEASNRTKTVSKTKYKCQPRPIPECLDLLRRVTEAATNTKYNFCLVNYYASGSDSISYHSDDESFLGPNPAIASFTLGARRDFLMKHKPIAPEHGEDIPKTTPIKLQLGSGDMVLMRGTTQAHWLHSIPKRKGADADKGRINITFRQAIIPAGTDNYYRYNVGDGGVYRWSSEKKAMLPWTSNLGAAAETHKTP